jgi:uncharacterized protein (TIGR03067 family)
MNPRELLSFLGCVLLAGCASNSGKGGGADQDSIQGTWLAERVELNGKVSDDANLQGLTLIFDGDKVITEVGGSRHEGTFTLDASRGPRQLEIKPAAGNSSDKPLFGVYALESSNNLRICFSQKSRPGGLVTGAHSDAILFELRRTPPRQSSLKITAKELVGDCRNNRSVASAKYKDQVVEVTGTVNNVKDGRVHLTAAGGPSGPQDFVEGTFNPNYKSELFRVMKIKNDQKVTLRGTFSGTFDAPHARPAAYVQLVNCEVVDAPAGEEKP